MKIKSRELFTILAAAEYEMEKHPLDYKKTLPIVKDLLIETLDNWKTEWIIDEIPF